MRFPLVLALAETATILVGAPLLTLAAFSRPARRACVRARLASGERPVAIVWRRLCGALPRAAGFVALATLVLGGAAVLAARGPAPGAVIAAQLMLLAVAFGLASLGLVCSALFADVHDAAAVAYATLAVVLSAMLVAGPYIARAPDAAHAIRAVLVVNPLVGVASILEFDAMRGELLYRISPIGQRRFEYPAWYTIAALYLAAAVVCAGGAIGAVAGLTRRPFK